MKEDIQSLSSRRDSRSSSAYISSVNTQDYFVTTKKLRDRVLTARSQGRDINRKTIRNMRSAPPFQNRNLDNYPMSYSREDAVRSARGHRTDKRDTNNRMVKERMDSGLMREYSKQMFEFSVKAINNSNGYQGKYKKETSRIPIRPKSEKDCLASIRTNGPTADGSILHNRKQKVLNSIRIRPHPEYDEKLQHERSCSRLSLQNTICDKNRHYRVRSVADSTRPVSVLGNASISSGDFIFEPVDQFGETNGIFKTESYYPRRLTTDSNLYDHYEADSIEGVFGKDPFDDIDENDSFVSEDYKPVNHKTRASITSLLPPDLSCNIRLVSLDEPSSSESEEEKEEPVVEVKKPEPPPPPTKPPARGKKNSKVSFIEEEKSKIPEPEPEPEPVKVKLVLKGPHCWVDDATVTSDSSDDEKGDNIDGNINNDAQHPQTDGNAEQLNNTQKLDNASKAKGLMKAAVTNNAKPPLSATLKQQNQKAMKDAFENALKNVQTNPKEAVDNTLNNSNNNNTVQPDNLVKEVIGKTPEDVSEDETETVIKLPPFLCPSSEKKSREAALKDWLAHTCFRTGHSAVPIV